jgi:methionyl-tRNA formyltransferase
MRFAALGRTEWLYKSILQAAERGHDVVLIGTCPAAPEYSVDENDFARLAEQLGCPFFCDAAINNARNIKIVQQARPEVAISVNWLTVIGQEMLNQFKHGIINAHAGDLPRFKGNAVPNWAILTGENKVVLTLHEMALDLDSGPILLQKEFPVTPDTYISDIYRFLSENIPTMFAETLDGLALGTITPRQQSKDPSLVLRCFPRLPEDGEIEWSSPAEDLARLVRASAEPFSGAYSYLADEKITIWRAHAEKLPYPFLGIPGQVVQLRPQTGEVAVLANDGILVLEEGATANAGRGRASELIKSTRIRLGSNLSLRVAALSQRVVDLEKQLKEMTREKEVDVQ